ERQPDPLVAPADPGLVVGRLPEEVDPPEAVFALAHPRLVRLRKRWTRVLESREETVRRGADDEDLETLERGDELVQPVGRDRHLEVLVLAKPAAVKEVDRPARGDVPRCVHGGEAASRLRGWPRVPLIEVGREAPA